jgi:carbonic anhydrase
MCIHCRQPAPNRRRFLSLAAAGVAASAAFGRAFAADTGGTLTHEEGQENLGNVPAAEALARLKAGNAKYVEAPNVCAINLLALAKQREQVAPKQKPFAAILTCADSRVPPELVFGGLGLGELFVARNAGNIADTATIGTIEYGVEHLGVRLVVVLGHQNCGAVGAACDIVDKHATFPGAIGPMLGAIVPSALAVRGKPGDFVDNTVRENAVRTANQIATVSEIVAHFIHDYGVAVLPARYDLYSGKVEFLLER